MRCAVCARFSSALKRDSSIEDQVRKCKEFASQQGWTVLENYVRFDQAVTGAALTGRDALQSLIDAAKTKPRPFDRILVDDTSRLAPNVSDTLRLSEILRFPGLHLSAVTPGIDSQH